ncbi:SidA/IucD/PvdA family monooxygenase, partial [Streptomyces sp. NPDC001811]
MKQKVHPVLGIGFGPANLSLAVILEEVGRLSDAHFIERSPGFQWQDEQLLSGADIQNNPFRDLAMQRNQDSPHTFIKYLASRGALTDYLHLNAKFPLRREYGAYLAWVAGAFAPTCARPGCAGPDQPGSSSGTSCATPRCRPRA